MGLVILVWARGFEFYLLEGTLKPNTKLNCLVSLISGSKIPATFRTGKGPRAPALPRKVT